MLQIAVATPLFFCLFFWCIIPESPRWLITRNKSKEAIRFIEKVAKHRRIDVPNHLLYTPQGQNKLKTDKAVVTDGELGTVNLFCNRTIFRIIIINGFAWFTIWMD